MADKMKLLKGILLGFNDDKLFSLLHREVSLFVFFIVDIVRPMYSRHAGGAQESSNPLRIQG
jgi:hypothetical protein